MSSASTEDRTARALDSFTNDVLGVLLELGAASALTTQQPVDLRPIPSIFDSWDRYRDAFQPYWLAELRVELQSDVANPPVPASVHHAVKVDIVDSAAPGRAYWTARFQVDPQRRLPKWGIIELSKAPGVKLVRHCGNEPHSRSQRRQIMGRRLTELLLVIAASGEDAAGAGNRGEHSWPWCRIQRRKVALALCSIREQSAQRSFKAVL